MNSVTHPAAGPKRFARRFIRAALAAAAVLYAASCQSLFVSDLEPDEAVVFYPSELVRTDSGWRAEIHGNVHDSNMDSALRRALIAMVRPDDSSSELERENFERRSRLLLADNLRWKRVRVHIADRYVDMSASDAGGHFYGEVFLTDAEVQKYGAKGRVPIAAQASPAGPAFDGSLVVVRDRGPIIISDIDDTIKISDVRDRKELMRNTFLRMYRETPGMPEFYRRLESSGATFFYVTASPWALYPELAEFAAPIYPPGAYRMKSFRMKDTDFFHLFKDPYDYKLEKIEPIIRSMPGRRFILIGDSGEKDPEAYTELARRFPESVIGVWIRSAYGDEKERMAKLGSGLRPNVFKIFRDPSEIDVNFSELKASR